MVAPSPVRAFLSAAPEDESLCGELERHLFSLVLTDRLRLWSREAPLDARPNVAVSTMQVDVAGLIILLLSADFFAYKPCLSAMNAALRRSARDGVPVIPVLARPFFAKGLPVSALQALPIGGSATCGDGAKRPGEPAALPVTLWRNRDEAWTAVVLGIERVLDDLAHQGPTAGRVLIEVDMPLAEFADEKAESLRTGVGRIVGLSPDQVNILAVEEGSARALIELPAAPADQLVGRFHGRVVALAAEVHLPVRLVERVGVQPEPALISALARRIGQRLEAMGSPDALRLRALSTANGLVFEADTLGHCVLSWSAVPTGGSAWLALAWVVTQDATSPIAHAVLAVLADDAALLTWGAGARRFVVERSAVAGASDVLLDAVLGAARDGAAEHSPPGSWRGELAALLGRSASDRHHPTALQSLESLMQSLPLTAAPRVLEQLPDRQRGLACDDLALVYLKNQTGPGGFAPLAALLQQRYPFFAERRRWALPLIERAVRNLPDRGQAAALGLGATPSGGARLWERLLRRLPIGKHREEAEIAAVLLSLQAGVAARLKGLVGAMDEAAASAIQKVALAQLPRDPELRAVVERLFYELP